MKSILMALTAGLALSAGAAMAADDGAALAKSSGCLSCHDVKAKKVGPAFVTVAEKAPAAGKGDERKEYKDKLVTKLTTGKGHMQVKASKDDVVKIIDWVVEQK